MRCVIALCLVVVGLGLHGPAAATQAEDLDFSILTQFFEVPPGGSERVSLNCPPEHVPLYATTPNRRPTTFRQGNRIINVQDFGPNTDSFRGAGYELSLSNLSEERYAGAAYVFCGRAEPLSAPTVPFERTLPPGLTTFLPPVSCGPGLTPVGAATNADGDRIQERSRVYLISFQNQVQPFSSLPDGTYGAPVALGLGYFNSTAAPLQLTGQAFCASLPNAQTLVTSASVDAGVPHSLFAGVPDGLNLVGNAFVASGSQQNDVLYWSEGERNPTSGLHTRSVTYARGSFGNDVTRPVAVLVDGTGAGTSLVPNIAKQQAVGRVQIASLVVPSATPVPPPTIVPIVEFYNATLDHYFITSIAKEISDLDSGVHVGWARTGESFSAYAVGSSGRTGRRPVCRAYGNPAAGLDSHFYSAVPRECIATITNFGDDWLLESTDVFDIELPDTTTGACPADRVAIYRLWNNRVDSSHRFVKTLALRAQMIARGFISEGYGPSGVVFCALS